ncbi:MAG: phytanoyl-CoA dioxygenase family protein [Candidatus Poribacteria bacterium]|nr:phytanoyl-CoA dioxygenase family protein [Candidatus Poribacteria bacterium]
MRINIDKCSAEILDIGYCILPGHFPRPVLETCREAFLPLLADVADRIPDGNRGARRWAIGLPFAAPFYHSGFFNDDTVIQIVSRILGENLHISYYGTDTPAQGSEYQEVHADLPFLFSETPHHRHPPALLAVRFTFVDVTPENGPFEVAERTQHLPRAEALEKVNSGEIPLKQLMLKAGDVLITDPRTLHRGTPNRTDTPRPFAVIVHNRHWYYLEHHGRLEANENTPILTESFYQTLSPRERSLLRRVPRTPD